MSLNITEIVAELGAYHRIKRPDIIRNLKQREDARKYFTKKAGIKDRYVMTEALVSEIIQPKQKGWQPKGAISFKPKTIHCRQVKVDFTFEPEDIQASWLGDMADAGSNMKDSSFAAYCYQWLNERISEDINKCVMNGSYVAPTPGVPGPAMTSFDGIIKVYKDAVTAGDVTPYVTGTLTPANIVDKVWATFDSIDEDQKQENLVMMMSYNNAINYFRKKLGSDYQNEMKKAENRVVDFTNCQIITPLYYTSNAIIITKPQNLIHVEDGVTDADNLEIQYDKRTFNIIGDFKRGVGFGTDAVVWGNEQA